MSTTTQGLRVRGMRGGYLLAEALVMLVLAVAAGAVMCGALISQARLARSVADRTAQNDAARTALHILQAELRTLDPDRDLHAVSADSVAARWIRGSGVVCNADADYVWVRIRGMRMLDQSKDSLLIISAAGEGRLGLGDAVTDAGGCPAAGDEVVYRAHTAEPALTAGAVLLFESGTYYLAQRALRYRVGAEGRQPLTAELLRDAGTGIALTAASAAVPAVLRMTLELRPGLQQQPGRVTSTAMPFANSRLPP